MNRFIKEAFDLLEKEDLRPESWTTHILSAEKYVTSYLKSHGYQEKIAIRDSVWQLDGGVNKQLQMTETMSNTINKDKRQGIIQGVAHLKTKLDSFLDYYNIGHIKEFHFKNKRLFVTLSLSCSSSFGIGDNQVSKEMRFKCQMDVLRNLGLTMKQERSRGIILANDKNREILNSILDMLHAKIWSYGIWDDQLHEVKVWIKPSELYKIDIPSLVFDKTKEMQKQDDIAFIKKSINELFHALSTIESMPNMIHTCGYIVQHCFADICNALSISTELSCHVESRHQETRTTNKKIQELNAAVGTIYKEDELEHISFDYLSNIGLKALKEIGFDLSSESFIDAYHVSLCFDVCSTESIYNCLSIHDHNAVGEDSRLTDLECEVIKYLTSNFDMVEPFPGEKYIAYTHANMDSISHWVEHSLNKKMSSFEVNSKNGLFYIKSFKVLLYNITC